MDRLIVEVRDDCGEGFNRQHFEPYRMTVIQSSHFKGTVTLVGYDKDGRIRTVDSNKCRVIGWKRVRLITDE